MISTYTHKPIEFFFRKNSDNFIVEEVPLYEMSNSGEWLFVKVRKKDLTTPLMIKIISEHTGAKSRDIGYAGLKDKDGLTTQYISIHKNYLKQIEEFSHPKIKIQEILIHNNKLKIGHLKGNNFYITLKKVSPVNAKKIDEVLKLIKKFGMPNYFGYQRFGIEKENAHKGEMILKGELKEKNRNLKRLFINAYQSKLFNEWLEERIKLSNSFLLKEEELKVLGYDEELIHFIKSQKTPFKLVKGDLMNHYPFGKVFELEEESDIERFEKKEITATGLLAGKKVRIAENGLAKTIEEKYVVETNQDGARRFAWIFPDILNKNYNSESWQYKLSFYLPKGSYATTFLEIIANQSLENLSIGEE